MNIDGINIYTKTMITCAEDLAGQIYVGREQLKVRSIGHCAMLEEDAMHLGTEADVSAHVLDISEKKTQLRGLNDTGAVLSVIPIETWRKMGFDKDDLIDSRKRLSAANKGALRVLGRTPIKVCIAPNPNSQSAAILGRSLSIIKSGLCVSVLSNTLDIPITIQRGRTLVYALPVKTRYEMTENVKENEVLDCPNHRYKICILKRLKKIKIYQVL